MDLQPSGPSSPQETVEKPKLSPRERYYKHLTRLLIRGFLEWGEYVDVDTDTIEDLLDGFGEDDTDSDETREGDEEDEEGQSDDEQQIIKSPETSEQRSHPLQEDSDDIFEEEFDAQFTREKQEVLSQISRDQLISDIKERGQAYVVNQYILSRQIPVSKLLLAFNVCLTPELRSKCLKTQLFFLRVAMYQVLQKRDRLPYSTVDDAVNLIKKSQNILILSGAGISVSCGIPDFRSRTGIYAMLQEKGEYDLDDPQQMFDIDYFKENPSVFYSFASQIYPSNFIPSPSHRFIKLVENKGKLLRNYTQNIDTLETQVGVRKVVQCHGSFATASCINCRVKVPGNAIEAEIMSRTIPLCKSCTSTPIVKPRKKGKKKKNAQPWESDGEEEPDIPPFPSGIMKPDITFFGEKLSDEFDKALAEDRPLVDLLIIIGTSLKVSPVADIPTHLRHSIPQIVINKTPILHLNADIVLLGNADDIVQHLCHKLQWDLPDLPPQPSSSSSQGLLPERPNLRKRSSATFDQEPRRVGNSHVWLFEGAEPGDIVNIIEKRYGGQPGQVEREDESDEESDSAKDRSKKARTK